MRITDFPVLTEIKNEYTRLRQEGASRDDTVAKLKFSYRHEMDSGAEDEGLLFWVGLADAQYALKELSEGDAQNAMLALNQIEQKDWQIAPGDLLRRRERYAKAPMPERKKISAPNRFRCNWEIGDTFAYQLLGNDAENFGLLGRYVLFRKVSEAEESGGVVMPVVTVSMWDDEPLPRTSAEFMRLPILKLDNGRAHTPKNQFIYRTEMLIDNIRILKQLNLQYLGNFSDVLMPKDEAVIEYVGYMKKLALNRIDISCCYYWCNHHIYESMK
jgi:hypothetical protein